MLAIEIDPRNTWGRKLLGQVGANRLWAMNRHPAAQLAMWLLWLVGSTALVAGLFTKGIFDPLWGLCCLPVNVMGSLFFHVKISKRLWRNFETRFLAANVVAMYVCIVVLSGSGAQRLRAAVGWVGFVACGLAPLFFDAVPYKMRAKARFVIPLGCSMLFVVIAVFLFDLALIESRLVAVGGGVTIDLASRLCNFGAVTTVFYVRDVYSAATHQKRLNSLRSAMKVSEVSAGELAGLLGSCTAIRRACAEARAPRVQRLAARPKQGQAAVYTLVCSQPPIVVFAKDTLAASSGFPRLSAWVFALMHHPVWGKAAPVGNVVGMLLYPLSLFPSFEFLCWPVSLLLVAHPLLYGCVLNRVIVRHLLGSFETWFVAANGVMLLCCVAAMANDARHIGTFASVSFWVAIASLSDGLPAAHRRARFLLSAPMVAVLLFLTCSFYAKLLDAFDPVVVQLFAGTVKVNLAESAGGFAFNLAVFYLKGTCGNLRRRDHDWLLKANFEMHIGDRLPCLTHRHLHLSTLE